MRILSRIIFVAMLAMAVIIIPLGVATIIMAIELGLLFEALSGMLMQEIPFILKTDKFPESKLLVVEENMARALTLKWSDFDLAKAVSY